MMEKEVEQPMIREAAITEEHKLVRSAQSGDRDAFCELVRRYRVPAVQTVYRMCGDYMLAEDAAQTAFLRAWEKLGDYRPEGSFRAWVLRIAVHAALDTLRRMKPEADLQTAAANASPERIENLVEKNERDRKIRQAVLALPEASRAVLVLKEFQGLTYREISEALEIPAGTVMSRLHYARSILAQTLLPGAEES
jgi:RNA polymerase sigma-70 factor (ECF subfamily)